MNTNQFNGGDEANSMEIDKDSTMGKRSMWM
jgi:hypothetical protein